MENIEDLDKFVTQYVTNYLASITELNLENLAAAIDLLIKTAQVNSNIFVGGNGGSAAISNHLCCDFIKGTKRDGYTPLRTFSLSCNTPLITAIANDLGYESTLSYQIKELYDSCDDICILISSSGNSENIVKAAEMAKSLGMKVIGLTGFSGGKLKDLCDISLHVPIDNYGVVEDCHQSLMHIISQYIYKQRSAHVSL